MRPALEHQNVTLLTNAKVVKLETNESGSAVTGVVVERDGETETFTADVVVVACGAANTARLLLSSANDKHPNGLANGSDQVGRNFMFHDSVAVLALSREENPTVYQKTLGLNDFYFGSDDFEFPLGNIQMVGKSQAADVPRREAGRDEARAGAGRSSGSRSHAIDFWLSTEDLPRPDNRVTVDGDGKVTLSYTETNDEAKKRLYDKLRSMLGPLDLNEGHLIHRFAYMKTEIPVAGCAHQAGTARMGSDPAVVGAERRLPRARARQPLRRRHERLPEHRRRQPGADGDGELAARRRPPARAARLSAAATLAPSGEQFELVAGDQRLVVVEVGAGLRSYTVGGRELLDGYARDAMCASGRGQLLLPWPNRIEDGTYEFDGRTHRLPLTEPSAHNAIHGLVRWAAWTAARARVAPASSCGTCFTHSPAIRSRSTSPSPTSCPSAV